jgi:hypothetical protein
MNNSVKWSRCIVPKKVKQINNLNEMSVNDSEMSMR